MNVIIRCLEPVKDIERINRFLFAVEREDAIGVSCDVDINGMITCLNVLAKNSKCNVTVTSNDSDTLKYVKWNECIHYMYIPAYKNDLSIVLDFPEVKIMKSSPEFESIVDYIRMRLL